jgi:hypothetical protein
MTQPDLFHDAVLLCGRLEGDFIGDRVYGRIFGDTLITGDHPFANGTPIRTSAAVSYEDGILLTQSGTRYRVEIDR